MVTNKPNIGLGILTADCQPVFFADPHSRIIGAAHAGWKGTLSGILEATIGSMIKLGATRENIHAVIGPSISQKAYEVGSEFVELFIEKSIENNKFFKSQKNGKFLFDLNGISLERLVKAGVKAESVNRCTYFTLTGDHFIGTSPTMGDYYLLLYYNIFQLSFSNYNCSYVNCLALSSTISKGTPTSSFDSLITNEVFTLATFSVEVNSSVRNVWKVLRSGATHLRIKSTSPLSMLHSLTKGQVSHFFSKAVKSDSA